MVRRILHLALGLLAGSFALVPLTAGATSPPTFTWTGLSSPSSPDWSAPSNWLGGVAPSAADGPVNLEFPPQCSPECVSTDDISGLIAQQITFDAGTASNSQTNDLTGSVPLTLDGGINDVGGTGLVEIDLPILLGGTTAQAWTIAGDLQLGATTTQVVTSTLGLDLVLSDGAKVTVSEQVEVGPLAISGANTADTGANASQNGSVVLAPGTNADLNGMNQNPVSLSDVELSGTGVVGPMTTTDAQITVGSTTSAPGGLTVGGTASSLDAGTELAYPWDPHSSCTTCADEWPSLSTAGSLNLASAVLEPVASCPIAVGTTLVFASATGGITANFTNVDGTPITNGEIIGWTPDAPASDPCPSDPLARPLLQITYGTTSVSATTVAETSTTTLSTSQATPSIGAPYTLTATVAIPSPGVGVATGDVTFNGPSGALCTNVALSGGTPDTATCQVVSTKVGTESDSAVYSGSTDGYVTGSTSNALNESVTTGSPPTVSAIPDSINFGPSRAGLISTPVQVEITNTGPGYDVIQGMRFVGSQPNDFIGATNCFNSDSPGELAPNTSCQISLGFAPVGAGASSAFLELLDNEPTPLLIPLAGVGTDGYFEATSAGQVLDFGDALNFGEITTPLVDPIVSIASTPDGNGYWLTASDGGVFAFGDAAYFGSTGGIHLNKPIVGMASTPDAGGYWLVASDGGIFAYGDAGFFGSTGSLHLNKPIVGMAATPDGGGYWLVASDGGIFAFGDAGFYGSTGSLHLNQPIVGMATTPDGRGYWLVASDGGIFAFGDAPFYGSTGNLHLARPIVGMSASPDGGGYWFVASDGGLFSYGDAMYQGSGVGSATGPVIGIAPTAPLSINDYLGVTPESDSLRSNVERPVFPRVR
jgi:hypothetical protein